MALFTDGPLSSMEDLIAHDSQLLEVASTEGIDVTRKLALAQEELGMELTAMLPRAGTAAGLESVVSTTALRLWHTFHALALVYRDAHYGQLNDRYKGKWEEYERLAEWAAEKVMQCGVGMVWNPVPQAQAPQLAPVTGPLPEGTYYVSVAWINGEGEEGAASFPAAISLNAGQTVRAMPPAAPAGAVGWNVFAGSAPDGMCIQNEAPIALNMAWTLVTDLRAGGRKPGSGQAPSYLRALPRLLQRG